MLDATLFFSTLIAEDSKKVRVDIQAAWTAFASAYPHLITASDAREKLLQILQSLTAQGEIGLPKGKHGWDFSTKPGLPNWIQILHPVKAKERKQMAEIPWPPELRFASNLNSTIHLETLLKIKGWLARGGRNAEPVPIKERSLEIFGDEKKLDKLLKTNLEAHITVNLLRCYPVHPALTWKSGKASQAGAVLILENLSTFHSFVRWNEVQKCYAACVYGAGLSIQKTFENLKEVLQQIAAEEILYFGDLDAVGLSIPRQLGDMTIELGLPSVRPASRWYTLLVESFSEERVTKKTPGPYSSADLNWLEEPVRSQALQIFEKGYRVPQELVGWNLLKDLDVKLPA
jgi:hypothetical protein